MLLQQLVFAAYPVPIYKRLASHEDIELTLHHNTLSCVPGGRAGLRNVTAPMPFRVVAEPYPRIRLGQRAVVWAVPLNQLIRKERFDVLIHEFRSRYVSLGTTMRLQRKYRGKCILWGIGFSQTRTPVLNRIRKHLANRADAIILYTERDKARYAAMGIQAEKLFVAYNTPGFEAINSAIAKWDSDRIRKFRQSAGLGDAKLPLHVGRAAQEKRLELLLAAALRLNFRGVDVRVAIVGEGPEVIKLRNEAEAHGIGSRVIFPGPIFDEERLAPWFMASDIVVAPAQIGLLAVHAAAYGKPLVTSNDPIMQGPELEVCLPGETVEFYSLGDVEELGAKIRLILEDDQRGSAMGRKAFGRARELCGVGKMANGVLAAVGYVTGRQLRRWKAYP